MKTVEELTKDKKLYIFDFDGVIADTGNDIAACVQKTQAYFGVELLSVDECYNELCLHYDEKNPNYAWIKLRKPYFLGPSNDESIIIKHLFTNPKMQESIHVKNILENRPSADVYIAAKAKQIGAIVVTVEKFKPNSAQLPNICESLGVATMSFDDFMGEYIK